MSRLVRLSLVSVTLFLLGLLAAWLGRAPLTEAAVGQWFAGRHVAARYRITAISPSAVTLAAVSLGPETHPDFTAERIEARLGWSLLEPRLEAVTLVRPFVRATVSSGRFSLGDLDRLLPLPSRTPKPLPDIDLRVIDGSFAVTTPVGPMTGIVAGGGRLRDGFTGTARLDPAILAASGCSAAVPGIDVGVATVRQAVLVSANGSVPHVVCDSGTIEALRWQVTGALPPTVDSYHATLAATAIGVSGRGYAAGATRLTGDVTAGSLTAPVSGNFKIATASARGAGTFARYVTAAGTYRVDYKQGAASTVMALSIGGASTSVPPAWFRGPARRATGTLARPLLLALATRVEAAARSFDGSMHVAASRKDGITSATLSDFGAHSAGGAHLTQSGSIAISDGAARLAGSVAIGGGGLPAATLTGDGRWRGGSASGAGTLVAARWTVPGASLDALRLVARSDAGGIVVDGGIRVSGAIGGLVADQLGVPLALRLDSEGVIRFDARCLAIDWRGLERDAVRLSAGKVRLCPLPGAAPFLARSIGGGMVSGPLTLRGSFGPAPLTLDAAPLHITLSGTRAAPDVAIATAAITGSYGDRRGHGHVGGRFSLAALSGTGRIDAAGFDDPASPVAIADAGAAWSIGNGGVTLTNGSARIADRGIPARFLPLRITDLAVSLAGGGIDANGSASLDSNRVRLFGFTATHAIASAAGHATVDTGTLVFGPRLQPYQITESLRGVVDNVRGPVIGHGRFDWTADTMTSDGSVRLDRLALATAALGPVDGIDGTIVFDDLLALTTPRGQTLKIARINPGVAVDDGVAVFRMLGPDAAAIDAIRWPYAGGMLTLAPVTIRAADLRRAFVLKVDGLDAQAFLQRFEIRDVNVTGTFDGTLPLVFAGDTGRIVAGRLVARAGGGLVQYVGAVGGEEMGAGAKLAFDALRRLRYHELALDLDGDLDGELVTQMRFSGTNETMATIGGGPVPIRATGLPFKFGITVRAPFRALLGTAASLSDVRPLLHAAPAPPVQ